MQRGKNVKASHFHAGLFLSLCYKLTVYVGGDAPLLLQTFVDAASFDAASLGYRMLIAKCSPNDLIRIWSRCVRK